MKKRILSFLMACFMVASTFIISKPLVHVHAVEGDESTPSVYGEWVFSGDATDYKQDNNFSIAMYGHYGDAWSGKGSYVPSSVMSGKKTEEYTYSTVDGKWQYTVAGPIVNGAVKRIANISYKGTNALGGISVKIVPIEHNISIEFTAPEDGIYSFEEIVKQTENLSDTSNVSLNLYQLFAFVVLKGDTIYDSYVTKVGSTTDNPSIGTLSGYVSLNKGEVLKFVAMEGASNLEEWTNKACSGELTIESLVVKKVAELPSVADTVYNVDTTLENEGMFKWALLADNDNGGYEEVKMTSSQGSGANFDALIDGGIVFRRTSAGFLEYRGANGYSASVTFTAPEDGTYLMNAFAVQDTMKTTNSGVTFKLIDKEGNKLDSVCYAGIQGPALTVAVRGTQAPLSATVELKAGDTVTLICESPENASALTSSIYNLNAVKVTIPGHPGEYHTDEEGAWITDADSHFFNRECCDHTDVADEPHAWGEDNVCDVCKYVCKHTGGTATCKDKAVCTECGMSYGELNPNNHVNKGEWVDNGEGSCVFTYSCCSVTTDTQTHAFNGDNKCDGCGFVCTHEGGTATCTTKAVCDVCQMPYGELNPNNHTGTANVYVDNKNGTHTVKYSCCDEVAEEKADCVYGDDYVCDHCKYDNSKVVANDTLDSVVEKWLADEDIGVTPEDFDETVLAGADVTKPAPDAIKGFEYKLFNLDFDADGNIFIRHHFFIEDDTMVTVNDDANLVHVKDNYYYYDVTPELGKYGDVTTIVVNDGVNTPVTIEVSLYSYIKVALESDTLSDDQANFLKVLCQLNEMAK